MKHVIEIPKKLPERIPDFIKRLDADSEPIEYVILKNKSLDTCLNFNVFDYEGKVEILSYYDRIVVRILND